MAAGLARTKVLAVLLGPSGLGITGVIDQIVAFLAHLGSMSIPFAALRYLSKYRTDGDAFASLYVAFRRALWISSAVALLGGMAFVTLRFTNRVDDLAPYTGAVMLGLVSIPAIAFIALDRNVLAVFDRSRMAGVVALVVAIALVASTYVGLRAGGLPGLYAGNLLVYGALAIFLSTYVRRNLIRVHAGLSSQGPSFTAVLRGEPGLVTFCTSIHLLTLASPAAYLIARLLLLDKWGAVQTGLMAAAFGFGVAVRTAMNQANALYLTPLTNRATPRSERAAAVSHYARTLTILFLLGVLPIVLFPDAFLSILYSRRFVAASASVGTFMIAEGLLLMAGVYQSLLIGFDDINGYTVLSVAANIVTIAASIILIPALGIIGCAIAFVCGNGILLILTLLRLATFHSLAPVVRETGVFWTAMLVLAILSWWVSDSSRSQLSLRIIAGLSGYTLLIAMLPFAEIRSILVARTASRKTR
jgi:antigen flippase